MEAPEGVGICPTSHSTSVTKQGPKPRGPDAWSPALGCSSCAQCPGSKPGCLEAPGAPALQLLIPHWLSLSGRALSQLQHEALSGCPCQRSLSAIWGGDQATSLWVAQTCTVRPGTVAPLDYGLFQLDSVLLPNLMKTELIVKSTEQSHVICMQQTFTSIVWLSLL